MARSQENRPIPFPIHIKLYRHSPAEGEPSLATVNDLKNTKGNEYYQIRLHMGSFLQTKGNESKKDG